MTRDELEALIWRTISRYGSNRHRAAAADVQAILDAADRYGRAEYGITAERRAVLAATRPPASKRMAASA